MRRGYVIATKLSFRQARQLAVLIAVVVLQAVAMLIVGTHAPNRAHAQTGDGPLVVTVGIQPNNAVIPAGTTRLFTATVFNNGIALPLGLVPINWTVAPNSGVIVSTSANTAVVSVRAIGTVGLRTNALTATTPTSEFGTASFTVTPGAVAAITVQPSVDTLVVGSQRLFTASATDAYGNVVADPGAAWTVSPTVGSIASSSTQTMLLQTSTTPGFFTNAIRAANGAAAGTATVLLQPGPPATVIITPSVATININTTQAFEAGVFDQFGNPLGLGVTWLAQGGTLDSTSPNSAVYRAGTTAGVFSSGLTAANGQVQRTVMITIPAGPPQAIRVSANPPAITTNGSDGSTVVATVVDAYDNSTGAGTPVSFAVDQCAGTCNLLPLSGTADAQGKVATTLRSTNISPTQVLTSQIKITAQMQAGSVTASESMVVSGSFVPYRRYVSLTNRDYPLNNSTSCSALVIVPPGSAVQASDRAFNIYRFRAQATAHTAVLQSYASTGQLLLYRVVSDRCATNGTLTLAFIASYPITSSTQYQRALTGLTTGTQYILAVNTSGGFSTQPYRFTIQ